MWLSALRREQYFKLGKDVPPAAYAVLIVDTGADTTMINEQLLRNLGLTPTSQTRVLTATSGGKGEACDVYDVCIEIVDKAGNPMWRVQPVEVLARPLLNQGTDGMLGRDLLDLCVLEYDGPAKVFRLTFPVSTVLVKEGRT